MMTTEQLRDIEEFELLTGNYERLELVDGNYYWCVHDQGALFDEQLVYLMPAGGPIPSHGFIGSTGSPGYVW